MDARDRGAPTGVAIAIVASVLACTALGAGAGAWRRRASDQCDPAWAEERDQRGPRGWVVGLLFSSYALLIPGLASHLIASETTMFNTQTVSEYDETMVSLVRRLAPDHMYLGAVLVTIYAMVVPGLKLLMLASAQALKRGGPVSVLWARRCILVVQAVSKWASPDMFAYILLMYLIRGLDNPPSIASYMDLNIGFTCFCVFCVGSTVSSLGIRVPEPPEAPAEPADAPAEDAPPLPRHWVLATVAFVVPFGAFMAYGLARPSMSLYLDMDLMYEVQPELKAMKSIIDSLNLPELLRMKVGVWQCMGALIQWTGQGEVNSLIAFILYAGFAVLLPILDMCLLACAALLDFRHRSELASRLLAASRKVRKLSMLDVSIMGCVVVTMSLRTMRDQGVIVEMCSGVLYLLGAEACHYAAAAVAMRSRSGAVARGKVWPRPKSGGNSQEEDMKVDDSDASTAA